MHMTPKVDVGFTEPLQAVSQQDTSTPSALAMAGDHSNSSLPEAAKQTTLFSDQKTLWMKRTRVSSG